MFFIYTIFWIFYYNGSCMNINYIQKSYNTSYMMFLFVKDIFMKGSESPFISLQCLLWQQHFSPNLCMRIFWLSLLSKYICRYSFSLQTVFFSHAFLLFMKERRKKNWIWLLVWKKWANKLYSFSTMNITTMSFSWNRFHNNH